MTSKIAEFVESEHPAGHRSTILAEESSSDVEVDHGEKIREKIKKELAKNLKFYKGLPYMINEHYFSDAFILNEDSYSFTDMEDDHISKQAASNSSSSSSAPSQLTLSAYRDSIVPDAVNKPRDIRNELYLQWARLTNIFKFQPMWLIREYYGEAFSLYFAWVGILITTLWIPTIVGIGAFIYGLQDR